MCACHAAMTRCMLCFTFSSSLLSPVLATLPAPSTSMMSYHRRQHQQCSRCMPRPRHAPLSSLSCTRERCSAVDRCPTALTQRWPAGRAPQLYTTDCYCKAQAAHPASYSSIVFSHSLCILYHPPQPFLMYIPSADNKLYHF